MLVAESEPRILGCLDMIKAEYREMPGLNLTRAQIQRMWSLEPFVCDSIIDALVSARFLRQAANGGYVVFGSAN